MKLTINNLSIDYTSNGLDKKAPVVFIHGFPFNQTMWAPQVQSLWGSRRLVTYDIRGHGKSDVGDGYYMLEYFVDDLVGLLDALKIEKAVLCGLSMGGYIALRAMERNPERVRALVLADTRSEADSNEAKLKRAVALRTVQEKGVSVFAEGFLKAVLAPINFSVKSQLVESVRQMINGNKPQAICGTLLALASRTDTTASLPKIQVPTLILVGEQDAITPSDAAEALHQRIASSELHILPTAGHLSNLENPDAFNTQLTAFLQKIN